MSKTTTTSTLDPDDALPKNTAFKLPTRTAIRKQLITPAAELNNTNDERSQRTAPMTKIQHLKSTEMERLTRRNTNPHRGPPNTGDSLQRTATPDENTTIEIEQRITRNQEETPPNIQGKPLRHHKHRKSKATTHKQYDTVH